MEIALIVIICVLVIALLFIIFRRKPLASDYISSNELLNSIQQIGAFKTQIDNVNSAQTNLQNSINAINSALAKLETTVVEKTGLVKDSVINDFQKAKQDLQTLKAELEANKQLDNELRESSRRIEAVIAGSRSRGQAGEDILAEAFKQFPPEVIETKFHVNGKVVEYAMILADAKRVPIDSKWPRPDLVQRLGEETDQNVKIELVKQIEGTLNDKVKEVTKYIDPAVTVSWGVVAVPEAVYNLCQRTHLEAFKQKIIVMPYSLAIIYLLSLYHLHQQYCSSVDIAKLEGYLNKIEDGLDTIDDKLENSISRGATMIGNAYNECKRTIGDMRGASSSLRAIPPQNETGQIEGYTAEESDG